MRESLGWVTNCDESHCPQNWLERAASEIPRAVECGVCGQNVQLVDQASQFEQNSQANVKTALPIVPCAGKPAIHNLGASHQEKDSVQPPRPPPKEVEPAAKAAPLELYCVLSSGDRIKCDQDAMVVGRSRKCDIVLPSAKVSRQHVRILRSGATWMIEDMGSVNGVWVNNERISQAVVIKDEDVFTISDETLTFQYR